MLSKLLCQQCRGRVMGFTLLVPKKTNQPTKVVVRESGHMIPPSQYDVPIPKRISSLPYVLTVHWETIPLFVTTLIAILGVLFNFIWASKNKVDVVFTTNSRDNISRMMDLRNPSNHKMITINQRYEPWPEMQFALDRLKFAEKRAATRRQCFEPSPNELKEMNA